MYQVGKGCGMGRLGMERGLRMEEWMGLFREVRLRLCRVEG